MTRPCEQTIKLSAGQEISPNQINALASGGLTFAIWLGEMKGQVTEDEILQIAEAIRDNWERYMSSA